MRKIVISAVNLNKGGTLSILRDCLSYLSTNIASEEYEVVAIVYDKKLAFYPNITYIETQWPKQRWLNRLWFEYVSMKKISQDLGDVYLWFSLHDTSPFVKAERQAVYCHNSFFYYRWRLKEFLFAPKIVLFSLFTKYIYKTNIKSNDYVVVQQEWFRSEFVKMFGLERNKIIISPPERKEEVILANENLVLDKNNISFLFPASADSHKNFEIIFAAVQLLEERGVSNINIIVTITGDENKYTRWLYEKYNGLKSIHWIGFLKKSDLLYYYENVDCLLFPSKVESWGLPISEFSAYNKPMILADLPYAHEAASGADQVSFFNVNDADQLSGLIKCISEKDYSLFKEIPKLVLEEPLALGWSQLFSMLLTDKK